MCPAACMIRTHVLCTYSVVNLHDQVSPAVTLRTVWIITVGHRTFAEQNQLMTE